MIFDWDDFHENNHNLHLFHELKDLNPNFKCTVFAIPGLGSQQFWSSIPKWIELAVHGWIHPHPREAENWSYEEMTSYMSRVPEGFVQGFKAPGWQISDGSFQWLLDNDWWVADQEYNNERRPKGLRAYLLRSDSWHGHIQNDCGNGMRETWDQVKDLVANAESFNTISEIM